jgi:hypothetical protein
MNHQREREREREIGLCCLGDWFAICSLLSPEDRIAFISSRVHKLTAIIACEGYKKED